MRAGGERARFGSASTRQGLLVLIVAAAMGLVAFGFLVSQNVEVQPADTTTARARFQRIREAFASAPPLVRRDESGRFVRTEASGREGECPSRLHVVVYSESQQRLISGSAPIWFLKVKGPMARLALRDTGFDLDTLGLTPGDLERSGPGLVVDDPRESGGALIAWTE